MEIKNKRMVNTADNQKETDDKDWSETENERYKKSKLKGTNAKKQPETENNEL